MEFKSTRKLIPLGKGSLAITLPRIWVDAHELREGLSVEVFFAEEPFLKVISPTQKRGGEK